MEYPGACLDAAHAVLPHGPPQVGQVGVRQGGGVGIRGWTDVACETRGCVRRQAMVTTDLITVQLCVYVGAGGGGL